MVIDLDTARRTAKWARDDIAALESEIIAYVARGPFRDATSWVIESQSYNLAMEMEAIPEAVDREVYRAIVDMRNALDQAAFGASSAIGTRASRNTGFPFGDDYDTYRKAITKGLYKGIPSQLHPAFDALEPYWSFPDRSGNDFLRELAELANLAKHRIPLTAVPETLAWNILESYGVSATLKRAKFVNGRIEFGTVKTHDKSFSFSFKPRFMISITLTHGRTVPVEQFLSRIAEEVDRAIATLDAALAQLGFA